MNIAVSSTSPHKVGAVREASEGIFMPELHIQGFKVASGVNEQPYGQEETLQGARNRMARLVELVGDTRFDLFVSMEGGVFPVMNNGQESHFDCGWVIARDAEGNEGVGTCTGVEYSSADVEEARRRGFDTTTIGSVIAERAPADATDTHDFLSGGVLKRADVLRVGLLAAIGQLLQRSENLRNLRKPTA